MKLGLRVPSLRKRIAARASWKRVVGQSFDFRAYQAFRNAWSLSLILVVGLWAVNPAACGSLRFDGVDDYVSLPVTQDLQLIQTDFTIEAWVYSDTFSSDSRVISGWRPGGDAYQLQVFGSSVSCDLTSQPYSNINFSSIAQLSAGAWHYLAMVRNGSSLYLYIDGALDSSGTNPSVTYNGQVEEIRIGRRAGGCCPYSGLIDEVRAWNRARSGSEIVSDMHRSLNGSEPGLIAYWRFDDGAGQAARDSTNRGNDGRLGDSTVPDSADPSWSSIGAPIGSGPACDCGQTGVGPHGAWSQTPTPASPPGRMNHGLVYDSRRGVAVLFGGANSCTDRTPMNDTWEFDGSSWVQVATAHSPPPRYLPGMAFDSNRGVVVLFGGTDRANPYSDTWEYDGTDWRQITPTTSPPGCSGASMAYDPVRRRVVARGQRNEAGDGLCPMAQMTWEYDGSSWLQASTLTQPPDNTHSNWHAPMGWSASLGKVLYFLDDAIWGFDGNDWAQVGGFTCGVEGFSYDQGRSTSLLTRKIDPDQARTFDTVWEWAGPGNCEHPVSQATYPQPRTIYGNTITYFAQRGSILFFGGFTYCSSQTFTDTWEYKLDSDGDGYADSVDCAPQDPTTYPGALQLCDGVNNNCSDPMWPTAPVNEVDADGDGCRVCGGDCNDSNPAVHPGTQEDCNGIDDNCDAQVDEGLGQTACGLGVCAHTVENCLGGVPQVCDPLGGATVETCDGLDNDCDGSMDEGCSSTCTPAPSGLVSWWTGDVDASDRAGLNPGILENGAHIGQGVVRGAFDLDGIDDYVKIPDRPSLSPTNISLEVWIYPRALPNGDIMAIVNKGDYSYRLQIDSRSGFSGGIYWALYCSTWIDLDSGFQPPLGSWTHVVGTYDGAVARVYVNGALRNSVPVGCLNVTAQDLAIGENLDFPARPNFSGLIDEVTLYSRALSYAEVQELYLAGSNGKCLSIDNDGDGYHLPEDCNDANPAVHPGATEVCNGIDDNCDGVVDEGCPGVCTPQPAGLISWWPGDANADDIVGSSMGALEGNARVCPGKVGSGFCLDGAGDYIEIGNPANLATPSVTLTAWARRVGPSSGNWPSLQVISGRAGLRGNNISTDGPYLRWAEGYGDFVIADSGGGLSDLRGATALQDDQWYLIAGTFDQQTRMMKLYVNGRPDASSVTIGYIPSNSIPWRIGASSWSGTSEEGFNGVIDEVQVYDRALSEAEVLGIYQAGSAGLCKCIDRDHDGYGTPDGSNCPTSTLPDCNDSDPTIHPGTLDESCNGIDENCSGTADEGYQAVPTTCGAGACASTGMNICIGGAL